jgi:4-hydroxybenzoyl-CoA reductase beta subunit
MLRLPPFEYHEPDSLAQAVSLLARLQPEVKLVSGGTDLLPNLKLAQTRAEHLVSLRFLPELQGIEETEGQVRIGAATRIIDVAQDELVRERLPALAHAAAHVASPQIRNMATLGGNLCLDTRCRYINQSELWREALGGCLKSHGSECHVVPGGQGCVAALSSDTVPPLIVYGAQVDVLGPLGPRTMPITELYDTDGLRHVRLERDEILVAVRIPLPQPGTRVVYRKWAVRKSIDFPLVSVAVRLDVDAAGTTLLGGTIAVGVLGPRPRVLDLGKFTGKTLDAALAEALGQLAFDRCRPLPNVPYDAEYRRERLAVETRRAVLDLLR